VKRLTAAVLLAVALVGSCSGQGETSGEPGRPATSGSRAWSGTTIVPTTIEVLTSPAGGLWPVGEPNVPELFLAALDGDAFLVGARTTSYPNWGDPRRWFVGRVSGEWRPVDPPPVDGVVQESGLAAADGRAAFVALTCDALDDLLEPAEPATTCASGYRIGAWIFDQSAGAWSEIGDYRPAEFGIDDERQMSLTVQERGSDPDRLIVAVGPSSQASEVFSIEVATGQVTPSDEAPNPPTIPMGSHLAEVVSGSLDPDEPSQLVVRVTPEAPPLTYEFEGQASLGGAAALESGQVVALVVSTVTSREVQVLVAG
jgi:hypothetical protein